jgi:hypothetical protein
MRAARRRCGGQEISPSSILCSGCVWPVAMGGRESQISFGFGSGSLMTVLMYGNNKKPGSCRSGFLDNAGWKCYAAFDGPCRESPATWLATKKSGRIHAIGRALSFPLSKFNIRLGYPPRFSGTISLPKLVYTRWTRSRETSLCSMCLEVSSFALRRLLDCQSSIPIDAPTVSV